ncbi:hypothetical protein AB0I66_42075 [Streptomyces sp. NPDC050439]|uniref:hypothetical protein n=1 Tax=unclassified Streptomyces TaxID=2593676 RepID=UPI003424E367
MSAPVERGESRRAANARKRISRRPSRLGNPAGTTAAPDHVRPSDAGFPGLLTRAWHRAEQAGDLRAAVEILLTLDGHVPADVQLRAMSRSDEAALKALFGLTWREQDQQGAPGPAAALDPASLDDEDVSDDEGDEELTFLGEIGLSTSGRIVLRGPSQPPLDRDRLAGGILRVPWSRRDLHGYRQELVRAAARRAESVADCRLWLAGQGAKGRDELLELAKEAAQRTAPFVLYQEDNQYTNFRDQNTLTGKTLWPGHPDCTLSSLHGVPLELWSDSDVQLVVCLSLLIASSGFGRVEEANGTQITTDHIAFMLERIRSGYNEVLPAPGIAPAASHGAAELTALAEDLRERRPEVGRGAQLYREIHGALMHKIERIAGPVAAPALEAEAAICADLRARLPLTGTTLAELGQEVISDPAWLAAPHGDNGTGLESLVHHAVGAVGSALRADFAMSRGIRSLPALIAAMRDQQWERICAWDLTHYFCCVVPLPDASRHFGGSVSAVADTAWAMSSRMQYNSWHFVPGNLPRARAVVDRDHFVPPTIPDISLYSDQHHHGHVNNKVRFSIRSPQSVGVDGKVFNGFIDLRLLRCEGPPFTEQDLLAAHRVSGFVATATGAAAELAAAGEHFEVTAFDSPWHWKQVTGNEPGTAGTGPRTGQPGRAHRAP